LKGRSEREVKLFSLLEKKEKDNPWFGSDGKRTPVKGKKDRDPRTKGTRRRTTAMLRKEGSRGWKKRGGVFSKNVTLQGESRRRVKTMDEMKPNEKRGSWRKRKKRTKKTVRGGGNL